MAVSDMSVNAARRALNKAGLSPEDIDLIIVATVTPDMFFPSSACFVQKAIGAENAACFDISAACSGFIYAMDVARSLMSNSGYKNALVIAAEKLSAIADWEDRNTCVLFGDGAGAVILSEVASGGILSSYLGADGTKDEMLYLPGGGSRNPSTHKTVDDRLHYLKMRGNELFKIAVRIMAKSAEVALERAGLEKKDVKKLIPHQANSRIIWATSKMLGLKEEQVFVNIDRYGNMSSASGAVALCEVLDLKDINKDDILLLVAFGGGLTWGATAIKVS